MATKYTLKKGFPAFDVVDGPLAGKRFESGTEYKEIPQSMAIHFDKVKAVPAKATRNKGDK